MLKVIPPETTEITNGQSMVKKQLNELGKLKPAEIRLIIISILLLFFWSTENIVHSIDTTTVTLIAVAIMPAAQNWRIHLEGSGKNRSFGVQLSFSPLVSHLDLSCFQQGPLHGLRMVSLVY